MDDVIGRQDELAHLGALVDAARDGITGAVVVQGEPGVGKTALLRTAASAADGFVRLETQGVEADAVLGYGCLLEVLRPLRARLDDVPSAQADALAAALGWLPAAEGDPYLVAAATLSLLAAGAEQTPLLVVVDDLHWVDAESAGALLFAARRMHHDRVAFVFAARPSAATPRGLPVLALSGLGAADARSLLGPDAAPGVAARLVAAVAGNPLALREAAARLSPAQRRGVAPLPEPLPIGREVGAAFEPLLRDLSATTRAALIVLAATRDDGARLVLAALAHADLDGVAAVEEAEERDVLELTDGRIRFRHPLLRSAVWRSATPGERRRAHRALAQAEPADHVARTWHLAQATTGHDDRLADALAAAAAQARRRQGAAWASTLLQQAAALTSDRRTADRHLAAAVRDAYVSGDLDRTRALARTVLAGDAEDAVRGTVLLTLGLVEQYAGSVPAAVPLLEEAALRASGTARTEALVELAITQFRLDDLAAMSATADRVADAIRSDDVGERALATFLTGVSAVLAGRGEQGQALVATAWTLLTGDPGLRDDPRYLCYAHYMAMWSGAGPAVVPELERRIVLAREQGALGVLVTALVFHAYARLRVGDHARAFADAGEALELAELLDFVADAAPAAELLALESAARGLHADAADALDRAATLVTRAGTSAVASHLAVARAYCALWRGDLDEVVIVLEPRLSMDGGRGPAGEPLGVAPLLVEAYVGLGRRDTAAALATAYATASVEPLPDTAALVARCRALTATDPDTAAAAFVEALAAHEDAPDRFEAARTRLLYGSWLRRAGQRTHARTQLTSARDAFAAWDLVALAAQADAELRATGATARRRRPLSTEPLTSQETRVAVLVAQGLSNREVAAALFLSPKTVEHHLSSVYRKRGLRSRTQLAFLLASSDLSAPAGGG